MSARATEMKAAMSSSRSDRMRDLALTVTMLLVTVLLMLFFIVLLFVVMVAKTRSSASSVGDGGMTGGSGIWWGVS